MEQKEALFNVRKEPLNLDGVDQSLSHLQYGIIGELPDGTNKLLNVCSKNYQVVKNEDFLEPIKETITDTFGNNWELNIKHNQFSRFFFDFIIKDKLIEINSKDGVNPRIRVINSYDGSMRFQLTAGFFRLICSNGITIPVSGLEHLNVQKKLMHTPGIIEKEKLRKSIRSTRMIIDKTEELIKPYRNLNENVIDLPDRVDEVIEETNTLPKYREEVLNRVYKEAEDLGLKEYNDWMVYNGFNYMLNHDDRIKTDEDKKAKQDNKVIDWLLEN